MRARTALAASALAALTLLWTAPAALAADGGGGDSGSTTTAPAPGDAPGGGERHVGSGSGGDSGGSGPSGDSGGSGGHRGNSPTTPAEPTPTPTPTPTHPGPASPQPVHEQSPSTSATPQLVVAEPRATVSVSPKTVRPGDTVTADARCDPGTLVSLVGDGVSFQGNSAQIGQNVADGAHQVTATCANGPKRASASDSFTVVHDSSGQPPKATLAVSPSTVRPGDTLDSGAACAAGQVQSLTRDVVRFSGTSGRVDPNAGDGDHTVTLVCANGAKTDTATGHFRVDRGGNPGGPGNPGDPDRQATLWVSPKEVRQGGVIYANGGCGYGRQVDLRGDDVSFHGRQGWVADNAREGDHTVTRVCEIGPPPGPGPRPQFVRRVEVSDHFRVIRGGPGNGPGPNDFWLSDRSGYRGDEVDASVRCRDDRAWLESDALDDITLYRDGSRLTGTTHVSGRADEGWHRVTVHCDGNSASTGFWVLRDRGDHEYLDLDPAYGHRGDAVDVHVGCDRQVGSLDSAVLDDIDLDHDGPPWRYSGTTHVSGDAESGEHTVRIRCGGDTLEVSFFVQGNGDRAGDNGDLPGGGNDVTVYPKGAPETGGGPVAVSSTGLLALALSFLPGLAGLGLSEADRRGRA